MKSSSRPSLSAHLTASVVCAACLVIFFVASTASIGQAPNAPSAIQSQLAQNSSRPQMSRVSAATPATPGVPYDFYLLTLSWSPEFCVTHADNEQCGHHLGFVVHGLWPENYDGTYPKADTCATRPGSNDSSLWQGVIPTAYLAEHEWQSHGICTPYDPPTYFGLIRKAFQEVTIPPVYRSGTQPVMLTPQIILDSFAQANPTFPAGSFALNCANNHLTEVRVCLAKNLSPIACRGVQICRANAVKITPLAPAP